MDTSDNSKPKRRSIWRAYALLVAAFFAQLFFVWLVGKLFPDIACSAYAEASCKPRPTTEGQMLRLFLPVVFIPLAIMQFKQVVMYAGALRPLRKLAILLSASVVLIAMVWQLAAAIGALLGRWFG